MTQHTLSLPLYNQPNSSLYSTYDSEWQHTSSSSSSQNEDQNPGNKQQHDSSSTASSGERLIDQLVLDELCRQGQLHAARLLCNEIAHKQEMQCKLLLLSQYSDESTTQQEQQLCTVQASNAKLRAHSVQSHYSALHSITQSLARHETVACLEWTRAQHQCATDRHTQCTAQVASLLQRQNELLLRRRALHRLHNAEFIQLCEMTRHSSTEDAAATATAAGATQIAAEHGDAAFATSSQQNPVNSDSMEDERHDELLLLSSQSTCSSLASNSTTATAMQDSTADKTSDMAAAAATNDTQLQVELDALQCRLSALKQHAVHEIKLCSACDALAFRLLRLEFLHLLQLSRNSNTQQQQQPQKEQTTTPSVSLVDVMQFAKSNFASFNHLYASRIAQLMGMLLFVPSRTTAASVSALPYSEMLDPKFTCQEFTSLQSEFRHLWLTVYRLPECSALQQCLAASEIALPSRAKFYSILQQQQQQQNGSNSSSTTTTSNSAAAITNSEQQQSQIRSKLSMLEIDLGSAFQFHSTFVCPVTREQCDVTEQPLLDASLNSSQSSIGEQQSNADPSSSASSSGPSSVVMLLCGHLISSTAMTSIVRVSRSGQSRFKCPTCPREQTTQQVLNIRF